MCKVLHEDFLMFLLRCVMWWGNDKKLHNISRWAPGQRSCSLFSGISKTQRREPNGPGPSWVQPPFHPTSIPPGAALKLWLQWFQRVHCVASHQRATTRVLDIGWWSSMWRCCHAHWEDYGPWSYTWVKILTQVWALGKLFMLSEKWK